MPDAPEDEMVSRKYRSVACIVSGQGRWEIFGDDEHIRYQDHPLTTDEWGELWCVNAVTPATDTPAETRETIRVGLEALRRDLDHHARFHTYLPSRETSAYYAGIITWALAALSVPGQGEP